MKKRRLGPLGWLMVHLSSFYRHLLTVSIFGLGYFLLGWVLYSFISQDLSSIHIEKTGLKYQQHLRDLLLNVSTHKYLLQRYYEGNKGLKNQILNVQVATNEDLRFLEKDEVLLDELVQKESPGIPSRPPPNYRPGQIDEDWKSIRINAFNTDANVSNQAHDALMTQILGLINYTANASYLTQDPSLVVYELVESASKRLPHLQQAIGKIMNITNQRFSEGGLTTSGRDEIVGRFALMQDDLDVLDEIIPQALTMVADRPELREPLAEAFGSYSQAVNELSDLIRVEIDGGGFSAAALSRFQNVGLRALNESFVLWDVITKMTLQILEEREETLLWERFLVISGALAIVVIGFFIGVYFVTESHKSLTALKETAIAISRGDLSARVPVRHRDEMGKVCVVFNHMAGTLERMIQQFRKLIHGTRLLASGDFSARLEVDSTQVDEIQAVGLSFNSMAESFEEVVSRLHRLVIDLTSSATQISAASKQHEASLTEQGATTKQISVTATEISATSKDFSLTLTEVGGVADETARLARMGQSSLVRMEKAMKKMEDAASNITGRLADLNEKASNITSVITAISEVSAQTNLLSLNAAIEAEKAGQAGQSFAVIAREIRGLSHQTAMSTLDIEKIVNEIVDAVKSSVMGVDDFTQEIREGSTKVKEVSEQLSQIMEQVKLLVERFDTVDQGMKNQSEAAEQINKALIDLSEMANETNDSMRHFHSTISHLDKAANDLRVTLEKIH